MKKILTILMAVCLFSGLTACREKAVNSENGKSAKVNVLATIFPLYDWAKNLSAGNDSVKVDLLLKDGVDMHSYQPSASDIVKISTSDIFIYVGGESDEWVSDALKNSKNENMIVINLMDVLKGFLKEEETVEGMQESEEIQESEEHDHEYDEHVWLSLNNAIASSNEIARALMEKDEANSQIYMANLVSYIQGLSALKSEYSSAFADKTIIVCDRFPFRYLTDEFGIKYYAAFNGCSAETEASFETIAFLAGKADELNVNTVFVTESSDKKIARTVISSSHQKDCKTVVLDSMQSTTLKQANKGANYYDIMRVNLEALK
ncbi:metal ABC transporter substrate-binding protein [Treponema sp.]|uniref:metal ABC transporter substrate-binding protein n=1 Tax=Treponema sp. TaxID=166 RepID=UPI00389056CF